MHVEDEDSVLINAGALRYDPLHEFAGPGEARHPERRRAGAMCDAGHGQVLQPQPAQQQHHQHQQQQQQQQQQQHRPSSRACDDEQQVDCNGGFPATYHGNFVYSRDPFPFRYNMGRDSPGMLDMLAEVASQTLLSSEKKSSELDAKNRQLKETKRKAQQQQAAVTTTYNVTQLLTMPAANMIRLFTVFTCDELKKQYSYTCALVPGCGAVFPSFASDTKAKLNVQQHLAQHLEHLKNNAETYASFTATAVTQAKPKSTVQNKKTKVQVAKKPHKETLNKENKETKIGISTAGTRKVLYNEVNLKELENNASHDKFNNSQNSHSNEPKKEVLKVKVSGDHSYYGYIKKDVVNDESTSNVNRIPVNSLTNENIMLTVVEIDGAPVNNSRRTSTENISHQLNAENNHIESMTLYPDDSSSLPNSYVSAKPKGKAKFIGTSEEERQRALAEIAKIKKYGNPPGSDLSCAICQPPRSFTAPTTLLSHYRSHAGIKPYACEICNSVFTRRHSLKYHMLIHDNLTRFTCADCGKKFRHPSHFREHRRRHTGEAPFGCEDCGQRFKTRNTYKRHLKTRHNKVLTITGELLHLSEEESKKVKPKSRRKRPEVSTEPLDAVSNHSQDNFNLWDEQQVCDNGDANDVNDSQSCVDNHVWVYENRANDITAEETFAQVEDKLPIDIKTEFNETEIEHNFANNEVVIAQTDSNGTLHFENYNYAQDEVYVNDEPMGYAEEDQIGTDHLTANVKHEFEPSELVPHEGTIVQYEECIDNFTEAIDPNFVEKGDATGGNVFILDNQDVITTQEVVESQEIIESHEILATEEVTNTEIKEFATTNATQTEEVMEMDTNDIEQNVNIIPCQVKVCENNGTATLQLIKNSKIALLGNKAQSINLIQNGKQQTFLLLASDDDNLLNGIDNNAIQESKSLPIVAVPAK